MQKNVKMLVEGAIMIALATVLSFIRVIKMPWGGSVTLFSMLPIFIYSIRWGVKPGLLVSFVYSLVQFGQGIIDGIFGWGLTPAMLIACIFIDYIFAFTVLGLAGVLRKQKLAGCIAGIAIATVLRFLCHFLSGVVIWKSYGELWTGFSTESSVVYSLLYNGAYMFPELAITLIGAIALLSFPTTKKLLLNVNKEV